MIVRFSAILRFFHISWKLMPTEKNELQISILAASKINNYIIFTLPASKTLVILNGAFWPV